MSIRGCIGQAWRVGWLLLIVVSLAACAGSRDAPDTELRLYTFGGYISDEIVQGFETTHGVAVEVETYSTNEEMLATLAAQPGYYDLIVPSDYAIDLLIGRSALRPLDLAAIPAYSNIEQGFLSPYFDPGGATQGRRPVNRNEKYSLPYLWGTTGIAYDKSKVTTPLTSWADLWRPDVAGHLVVLDDAREMMGLALLSVGYDKNSTNPLQLAEARDRLKELVPGIVAYDADEPERYLISGEAWVGVVYNGNAALAAQGNPNIVYVLPQEGAGIWFDNLAIPADAPHPQAAHAFINYLLDAEVGAEIAKTTLYSTPNEAALEHLQGQDPAFYESYMQSMMLAPPREAIERAQLVKNVGPSTASVYEQHWAEVKESSQ